VVKTFLPFVGELKSTLPCSFRRSTVSARGGREFGIGRQRLEVRVEQDRGGPIEAVRPGGEWRLRPAPEPPGIVALAEPRRSKVTVKPWST
jgi:hypothetical protein